MNEGASLEFRALRPDDAVRSLKLGSADLVPLKAFLANEAKQLQSTELAKTLVAVRPGESKVLAYATLVCANVAVERFDPNQRFEGYRYTDYPAVKLARLAVDVELQGQGIGSTLVGILITQTLESIVPLAGCRFMVVDAKSGSVGFYKSQGFEALGVFDGNTLMYIDLHAVSAALAGRGGG